MAVHTIRRRSQDGVECSVVELADIPHLLAVAVPRRGTTLRQQVEDALGAIASAAAAEDARRSVVLQSVFLADIGRIDECRRIVRDFYGSDLPVTTYIPQLPCDGKLVSIEAMAVGQDGGQEGGNVEIQRHGEQLAVVRHSGITWLHCGHIVPDAQAASVYDAATSGFRQMRALLDTADVRFDRVVRTWLYLGGIVETEGAVQRYQELNRARTDFYCDVPFLTGLLPQGCGPVYPASTGIGAEGRGVTMSALALATDRPDVTAVPLENPRQTAAYNYDACYSPKSPKFSRAMALRYGDGATIFVSGTASITHSETRHVGDAVAQTRETLENITALISEDNLSRHGLPGLGTTLESAGMVRVYVKRQEDYAKTRAVCEQYLGSQPVIYTLADVCRPELLVEIEALAFARKAAPPPHEMNGHHFDRERAKSTVA